MMMSPFLFSWSFLLFLFSGFTSGSQSKDPQLLEEYCKNFTHGTPGINQFYSPMYPREYPSEISCFRTITAEFGYFVRIDFRDMFRIEPPNNEGVCDYDYLEIRDGDQGYAPLIGRFCGDKFPPIITSSGRSLWLRFTSDSNIQYTGFKAVYTFIQNPMDNLPDIGKCTFEIGGHESFIGSANISQDRIEHSLAYDTPIDCVWTIRTDEDLGIYIQFTEYKLQTPNDCNSNFIQVFHDKTHLEHQEKLFCGSVAEAVVVKSNLVFIRFYAEKAGLESEFIAITTAFRDTQNGQYPCDPETEYDCDDATCINPDLVCNGIRNCKFGWDEETCIDADSTVALDFTSPHVVIILLILIFILIGMGVGGSRWLIITLREDKEEIEASREKSLGGSGAMLPTTSDTELPSVVPPQPRMKPPSSMDENGGCYVPDGGFPFNSRF